MVLLWTLDEVMDVMDLFSYIHDEVNNEFDIRVSSSFF